MTSGPLCSRMRFRRLLGWQCRMAALFLVMAIGFHSAFGLEWIGIAPNPAYTRDLSMGASTVALNWAPQSQSTNPAGLALFDPRQSIRATVFFNPGGLYQLRPYWRDKSEARSSSEQIADGLRLLLGSAAVQFHAIQAAVLLTQPVMTDGDTARYSNYSHHTPLDYYQSSLMVSLALHPRVSLGGRLDRYYSYDTPMGEAYSYGVILRPRHVTLGVQYQRFPASGKRLWHPLDRRDDQTTTAGVAVDGNNVTLSVQVMNLTQSDHRAFLEPHAGVEWRITRGIALRAGGLQYSGSARWAWTTGIGLLDANWIRNRALRLLVPDEVLQVGLAVIYNKRTPILGIGSLTCAWRL
jgi:hypothetical protein